MTLVKEMDTNTTINDILVLQTSLLVQKALPNFQFFESSDLRMFFLFSSLKNCFGGKSLLNLQNVI